MPAPPRRSDPTLLLAYVAIAGVSATGGLRPTGLSTLDPVLLGAGGIAVAACARRARAVPVYLLAATTCVLQPEVLPLVLGLGALAAAFLRRFRRSSALAGILAGGLSWCALVGAGGTSAADPVVVPLLAVVVVVVSARRSSSRRFRRRIDVVVLSGLVVVVVAGALATLAVLTARPHVDRGTTLLRSGLDAARDGDPVRAVAELRRAEEAFSQAEATLGAPWARPAWVIPGLGQNARAIHQIVAEVDDVAQLGITSAERADVDSLRFSQGGIELASIADMADPLEDVVAGLGQSAEHLEELESWWLLPPVDARLDEVQDELDDAIPSAELALDGVRVAPAMLGGDGPRTYLVLFTTPVEARARTGFPGNFAELTFIDGRFEKTRFGRITELNSAPGPRTLDVSDEYRARYDRFSPATEWRSLTFTPDFPTVADSVRQLYPQSGGVPIDGVVSLDPAALAELLRFTGPVAVPGVAEPITSDNAERFLVRDQYLELPDTPERIDALEVLADATFDRLQQAELPGPRDVARVLGPVVEEGHIQIWTFDELPHDFLGSLGISGAFPAVDGDFLGLTTSNTAMNKIDLFMERTIDYDATWDPDTGAVDAVATITLTNTAPPSGLPAYVIGNSVGRNRPDRTDLPDGWNESFVTLYTPWQPGTATIDDQPLPLEVLPEAGRRAISTFVQLAPGQTRTIRIELSGVLDRDDYVLDLVGQPMVVPDQATVSITAEGRGDVEVTGPAENDRREVRGSFPLVRPERIEVEG